MSTIVVARFDSLASARSAAYALVADGFAEDAVSLFYGESSVGDRGGRSLRGEPDLSSAAGRRAAAAVVAAVAALGALAGAGLCLLLPWSDPRALAVGGSAGGYVGALIGAFWMVGGLPGQVGGLNSGLFGRTVLVAVQVHLAGAPMVMALLRDAGGVHVAQARGPWQPASHPAATAGTVRAQDWRPQAVVKARAATRRTQWQP